MRISDWSSDVCSSDLILRHGGSPIMWRTGHSLIKAKMKETEAELAGEMSGHFFFRERWYGFDDGIYAAARLLEILAARGEPPEDVFAAIPKGLNTPELKIDMAEGERSEEHTSEPQSLMRISYAVFCLKQKKTKIHKKIMIK